MWSIVISGYVFGGTFGFIFLQYSLWIFYVIAHFVLGVILIKTYKRKNLFYFLVLGLASGLVFWGFGPEVVYVDPAFSKFWHIDALKYSTPLLGYLGAWAAFRYLK